MYHPTCTTSENFFNRPKTHPNPGLLYLKGRGSISEQPATLQSAPICSLNKGGYTKNSRQRSLLSEFLVDSINRGGIEKKSQLFADNLQPATQRFRELFVATSTTNQQTKTTANTKTQQPALCLRRSSLQQPITTTNRQKKQTPDHQPTQTIHPTLQHHNY